MLADQFVAGDDGDSLSTHIADRVVYIGRSQIDPTASVFNEMRLEAERLCVERGELYAIVSRETHHVNPCDTAIM